MKIKISIITLLLFTLFSCKQEDIIFYPEKLPENYQFSFRNSFKEYFIQVDEHTKLNGLLFEADSSKGLIFYLHGNAGALNSWGNIADVYLRNNYDFFVLDYRGYGKSEGEITSESQFYNDIQIVYDTIKTRYNENNIVIIGFSIGTGSATWLACKNSPKHLILEAPYYNLTDLAQKYFSITPSFLVQYKFKTNELITKVKCPVTIFHGNQDEVIYYGSSKKLEMLLKQEDQMITLPGQKHNGISNNPLYRKELKLILE